MSKRKDEDENGTETPPKRRKTAAETEEAVDGDAEGPEVANESELYLETVDRTRLDFDFEKVCSISLSNLNVYACLICGKYFQGRGKSSYAYYHSLDEDHHIYIHLASLKVYSIPEGYEVKSTALNDIKYIANPSYTMEHVSLLDTSSQMSYDLQRRPYHAGFIGLNNIQYNDYINVVVQALAHTTPVRDYFLVKQCPSPPLLQRFGLLLRKLWNPQAFKPHVSPHELLQQVVAQSGNKFRLTEQGDPLEFLTWLVDSLHVDLGGSRHKFHTSIIHQTFQGRVRVESQKITVGSASASGRRLFDADSAIDIQVLPFIMLALDLPPSPVFTDAVEKNFIPQVNLEELLRKYDGSAIQDFAGQRKRYKLVSLPPLLIFHIKRFTKNNFRSEKNPTVVRFPTQHLDMRPFVDPAILESMEEQGVLPFYNLCCNITHKAVETSVGEKHSFQIQIKDKSREEWFQIQDLNISTIQEHLIHLGESYIQIWERTPM